MRIAWVLTFGVLLACGGDDSSTETTEGVATTTAATTTETSSGSSTATSSGSSTATSEGESSGSGGATSSTGGSGVTCGDCDAQTEFCFVSIIDGPSVTSCEPIPERCIAMPDCSCIEPIACSKGAQSCGPDSGVIAVACVEG